MLPTKQVDTNYGYDGNYKETNEIYYTNSNMEQNKQEQKQFKMAH